MISRSSFIVISEQRYHRHIRWRHRDETIAALARHICRHRWHAIADRVGDVHRISDLAQHGHGQLRRRIPVGRVADNEQSAHTIRSAG